MTNINQDGKYFNVHIENDHYYITRSSKSEGALKTLENIEEILTKNLTYDMNHKTDAFAKMSKVELQNVLKEEADQIIGKCNKKIESSTAAKIFERIFENDLGKWLIEHNLIFRDLNKLNTLEENIKIRLNHAEEPFSLDIAQDQFSKYLPFSDLISLSMLNRESTSLTEALTKNLAQELGYIEKENKLTPKEYLKELFDEVDMLIKAKLIPKKYIVYINKNKGSFDAKQTLQNLKKLSDEDLVDLFSRHYSINNYYTSENGDSKVLSSENFSFLKSADKILNVVKFKNNMSHLFGGINRTNSLLHDAIRKNNIKIVKMLIDQGAPKSESFCWSAINSGHKNIHQLLLNNGFKDVSTEDYFLSRLGMTLQKISDICHKISKPYRRMKKRFRS